MRTRSLLVLLVVLRSVGTAAQTDAPLRITSITPAGTEVPRGRQIVVQFDRPMVPVGRMERRAEEIPVTIEPSLGCRWRWLNTSALACQLAEDDAFAPATRYRVVIEPGLEAEDGTRMDGPFEHVFVTERPAVASAHFDRWLGPGTPRIRATFNQLVSERSVEEHVAFRTADGTRREVDAERPDEPEADERHWMVAPVAELPLDATIELVVEAGLRSEEGPLPAEEARTAVATHTFPEHSFLGVRCHDNAGREWLLGPEAGVGPSPPCNPMAPVELVFSSSVIEEVIQEHLALEPDLGGRREDYDPWDAVHGYSRLGWPRSANQDYSVCLPELFRARETYRIQAAADELLDEFGRPLTEDVDFLFRTDDRPPRAVLTHPLSTLEKNVETHVPLVVTNLDRVDVQVEALTAAGVETFTKSLDLPEAPNVAFRVPLAARNWLSGRSGVLFGDVQPAPATEMDPERFFSQVTPFAVHVKLGHQNTAVWVTDLSSGEPVEGARVFLYRARPQDALKEPGPLDEGTTNAEGLAFLEGQKELNPKLETQKWEQVYRRDAEPIFFVRVEKSGDLALLPMSSDYWIYPEATGEEWIPTMTGARYDHIRTWGTTAQGVHRLGDAVHYKLYVRDQDNERFVPAPRGTYLLRVLDPMDKVVHEVSDIELNEFGAHAGSFRVPDNGAVGWYRFHLTSDFHEGVWQPLTVLVADFTPAPFRVTTDIEGERFAPGDELRALTKASLHAGGPYGGADARVTLSATPVAFRSENPKAKGFWFGGASGKTETLHQVGTAVDAEGELATAFTILDPGFPRGRMTVESAVRDDRGKYVASAAAASYLGRDRLVGVRLDGWLLQSGETAELEAIVVNEDDEIAEGASLTLTVRRLETTASRVKGAGNAYVTQYNHEWVDVTTCEAVSTLEPTVCSFTPDEPGRHALSATVVDTEGRLHEVSMNRWAVGRGQVVWEESPGFRLDIEPEEPEYRVGDTARFLVRNPFPGARALLTVERLGVQHHWTEILEESSEVIELEITEDHVPGFYLSAVVASPRVEAPPGDGEVDLGKPAFRMGYVRVPVRDPVKEILVDVTTDRELYRPRDTVRVTLEARPRQWASTTLPPLELAVAVLDEAVLDLISRGDAYFDPYRGFYELEPLDVENYNLLTRLVGIQSFEKKGANAGGGGGGGDELRTDFELVSYWNPSIETDADGRARFELEVPDNLTGWRILVLAVSESDRMGLGQGRFVVNRPTELRPALPNQVTEGDLFEARFTLMNRTEEVRVLNVAAEVAGSAESEGLASLTIDAEPYRRYPVTFPVRATSPGEILFTVRGGDLVDGDALTARLPVGRRAALETAATYGTTTEAETTETFAFPEDMRTDVGRVSLVASPSVLGNVEGAFDYLRDYPYQCWEQKLTKAVMASHFRELEAYVSDDFSWPGHETLPAETLALSASFQAPNGGMVYWVPDDAYASPYLSAYTALAFHWLRERGERVPSSVQSRLHGYLEELLRKDVLPDFYSRGMASTVRAVALAALALAGSLEPEDLDRYRTHVPDMDLFGKAHFLMAAEALGVDAREVRESLLARSNRTGGTIVFTESVDDGYERILHSAERTQCAVASALVRSGDGELAVGLTRAITQSRGRRDRWENTQENVFCMNALVDYARVYESVTPSYRLRTFFDGELLGEARFDDLREEAVEHERPLRGGDPGRRGELRLEKRGTGRVYYGARLSYAPRELRADPVHSGIEVRREYSVQRGGEWLSLAEPMTIRAGELVRVDLFVSLPGPRHFVVVDDPVPGGLEAVNRDLATASVVDAEQGEFEGAGTSFWFTRDDWFRFGVSRWSFYHRELRHGAARFFSEYLPAGNYHLSYVAQAIASGTFQVLPTRAEEMYDPDVFGLGTPGTLVVERTP